MRPLPFFPLLPSVVDVAAKPGQENGVIRGRLHTRHLGLFPKRRAGAQAGVMASRGQPADQTAHVLPLLQSGCSQDLSAGESTGCPRAVSSEHPHACFTCSSLSQDTVHPPYPPNCHLGLGNQSFIIASFFTQLSHTR